MTGKPPIPPAPVRREPALKLGLGFGEALERFVRTDPGELPPEPGKLAAGGKQPPAAVRRVKAVKPSARGPAG